jgi:predicted nucleic acid-binding protein
MSKVFADSFYFIALMNVRDSCHAEAVALSERLVGPIITTQWVLVEVADAFAGPKDRDRFLDLLELIRADNRIQVIAASKTSFERGVELFARREDKSWPLTDCISFVIMEKRRIKEALTGDRHFVQAGFVTLMESV